MLVTWQVSGRDYFSREFLRKQPSLSPSQEGKVLWEITNRPGGSALAGGVTHGKPFQCPVNYVLEYLNSVFYHEKLLYRTIGLHRSAIST